MSYKPRSSVSGGIASRGRWRLSSRSARRGVDEETQLVTFTLAGMEFGVPIEFVKEIVRVPDIIAYPDGPLLRRGSCQPARQRPADCESSRPVQPYRPGSAPTTIEWW